MRAAIVCSAVLAAATVADAHALDEYVQALRVAVSAGRVELTLDLTPGANIAADVMHLLDADNDGAVSPSEAEQYGRVVLSELVLAVDGHRAVASLTHVDVSSVPEIRAGVGTIRIRAVAAASTEAGAHRVDVRNDHHGSASVYLANALIPDSSRVQIERQSRDARQQAFSVDYRIARNYSAPMLWLALASVATVVFVRVRW